jgi:hypothetical protein
MAITTTIHNVAKANRIRLQAEGLWDNIADNVKAQWPQRHYNNKALKRIAEIGTDEQAFEWIERFVDDVRKGGTGFGGKGVTTGESAESWLERMSAPKAEAPKVGDTK